MTAPLVTAFGTPWHEDAITVGYEHALNHLARPIRHRIPGTLWERVEESGNHPETDGGTK